MGERIAANRLRALAIKQRKQMCENVSCNTVKGYPPCFETRLTSEQLDIIEKNRLAAIERRNRRRQQQQNAVIDSTDLELMSRLVPANNVSKSAEDIQTSIIGNADTDPDLRS